MVATIRDYGLYPCPRCLVPKDQIFKIGREDDRCIREELRRVDDVERQGRVDEARTNLYENGYALSGDKVDGALKDGSLVPTLVNPPNPCSLHHADLLQNAFSQTLFKFGFDFFRMLTVDLLHEYELGVGKDFLTHIVRILEFLGPDKVQAFNERYVISLSLPEIGLLTLVLTSFRQVPAFGETIRRFEGDVSEMKRLAAHDFEDLLQVSQHSCDLQMAANFSPR